jgi:hypothetical protein
LQLEQLETVGQDLANVPAWVERRAQVRSNGTRTPDDELTRFVARTLHLGEAVDVPVAMQGQDEQPTGSEHATQFVPPLPLALLRQVREDGDRRYCAEPPVLVRERLGSAVPLELREPEVRLAPPDGVGVTVAAMEIGVARPVADHAPAAAAEVEVTALGTMSLKRVGDRRRGQPPALEEPLRVGRPGGSDTKAGGRQVFRDAAVRAERLQRLVPAEELA